MNWYWQGLQQAQDKQGDQFHEKEVSITKDSELKDEDEVELLQNSFHDVVSEDKAIFEYEIK